MTYKYSKNYINHKRKCRIHYIEIKLQKRGYSKNDALIIASLLELSRTFDKDGKTHRIPNILKKD